MKRNKVLILSAKKSDREHFGRALFPLVEKGGELFFASHIQEAKRLASEEHPGLIFIDQSFTETETWDFKESRLEIYLKPPTSHQLHEMCLEVFGLKSDPPPPPM